jgi:hypothetical protein
MTTPFVPAGKTIKYGYVPHQRVVFEQYGGTYLPAIEKHLHVVVNLGAGAQPLDCPFGYWRDDLFVICDGRHRYMALLIAGFHTILVRWQEDE